MVKKRGPPAWIFVIWFPLITAFTAYWLYHIWTVQNKVPHYIWNNKDPLYLAITCSAVSTVFIFLQVQTVATQRLFTKAGDTIYGEESDFLKLSKNVLQNTLEQSFLFIINLLAAAVNGLPNERIVLVTMTFILARILFWCGYVVGVYIKFFPLRGPGFLLTFSNNVLLLLFNVLAFIR
ncbi:unnamed protein product [Blepharisma stoltei]|uniref:MAPEG family protein n=1 Tax=Blepharisma stoltei TaxID=1481888 RepID=A0AAU9J727_9CILI|nr:unnamed protein product [Blepharisma stoltei]